MQDAHLLAIKTCNAGMNGHINVERAPNLGSLRRTTRRVYTCSEFVCHKWRLVAGRFFLRATSSAVLCCVCVCVLFCFVVLCCVVLCCVVLCCVVLCGVVCCVVLCGVVCERMERGLCVLEAGAR